MCAAWSAPSGTCGCCAPPALAHAVARGLARGRAIELRDQDGGEHVARQVARAEVDPGVLVDLAAEEAGAVGALLADDLGALLERAVVHDERAALAARHVLGVVE